MPPLGWLGAFIIVLFFVLRATPWLVRGYDYRFHYHYRACAFFLSCFGVGVFNVL